MTTNYLPIALLLSLLLTQSTSFCPQYCGCNDTSLSVQCHTSSNLRVVPIFLNPQIKSLSLSHNQIKDITLSLQFYQELVHLDLSSNQMSSLGKGNFESLRTLETLNVSYNQVKVLEGGVFQGLGSLGRLDLTGNQVERMDREVFWNLRNLREIVLDRNRLEFIDWDLFRGLGKLQRISVQYNFIQVIEPSPSQLPIPTTTLPLTPATPPYTLPSVRTLDVSSNQLTRVKDNSLSIFTSLKELNLCCNYIHTLEDRAFTSLPALERVNLSQNRLGRIPTGSLGSIGPSLKYLDLSSNRLSDSIPATAFRPLHNLEFLRLNDNPGLTSLHQDSLSEQMNLVSFEGDYLSNLTEFSGALLVNKPRLGRFSLRYAQVGVVPLELVDDFSDPSARVVDLSGNPIECNCSAYKLFLYLKQQGQSGESADFLFPDADFLQQQTTPFPLNHSHQPYVDQSGSNKKRERNRQPPFYLSTIRCANPPSLTGILVKDLKDSDFSDCFTSQDHFQVLVIIIAASILSLIFIVVCVKLCCFSSNSSSGLGGWCRGKGGKQRCRLWPCGSRRKSDTGLDEGRGESFCPCFGTGEKELENKDRLFDGFRGSGRMNGGEMGGVVNGGIILPQSGQQMMGGHGHFVGVKVQQSPSGKLFFSADNSTTPSHHPQPHPPSNSYTYTPINSNGHIFPPSEQDPSIYHPHHHNHTLRSYKPPLPPLPPYTQTGNFTLFHPKPNKPFREPVNEYTSPLELNLQHQSRPGYVDYHEDEDEEEDDTDTENERPPHRPYGGGSSGRSRKGYKNNGHSLRNGGHFGGSSTSFGRGERDRERERQVPSVLV